MNRIFEEFKNEEVISYWATLFPNFHTQDSVVNHIEKMIDMPLEQCGKKGLFNGCLTSRSKEKKEVSISREEKEQLNKFMKESVIAVPVYKLYEDIIYDNIGNLLEIIKEYKMIENKSKFISSILKQLEATLYPQYIRTIILELNCAREDGTLKGSDSHERYNYFVEEVLSDSNYKKQFYEEYESLLYVATEIIQNCFDFVEEILINTQREIDKLENLFLDKTKIGKIQDVAISEGDTHCNGKSVAIIYFSNLKIVYKPRNMEVDLKFQKFIQWINSKNIVKDMKLATVKIHTTSNCGWMEYIEQKDCNNEEELKEFYVKSGMLLGILYSFNAVDFHFENIIAYGKDPVLVDLETLFHPDIKYKVSNNLNSGFQAATEFIAESVSKIGLLPTKMRIKKDDGGTESVDVGALSESKEQSNILRSLVLENLNTDKLCLSYKYLTVSTKKNGTKLLGKTINPKDYMNELIIGFETLYKFADKNKDEMLSYTLDCFEDCRIRVILKSTVTYTSLLSIASHPDFMREPIHRVILLSKIGANDFYNLPIKRCELSELCRGQIPYFYTSIKSHDLQGYPDAVFHNNIDKSVEEILTDKFNRLSYCDMQKQVSFIKDSFFTRSGESDRTGITFNEKSNLEINSKEWVDFSEDIAKYIISRSFKGKDDSGSFDRAFIGAQTLMTDTNDWNIDVDCLDLYDGNAGTALFFANLWKVTGNKEYYNYAFEAIQPIVFIVDRRYEEDYKSSVGAYKGLGGLVYAINKIELLTNAQTLYSTINGLYDIIENNIDEDVNYDFIGGGIGCLACLLSVYEKPCDESLKDRALDLSIRIYKFLNTKFKSTKDGKVIDLDRKQLNSGFAHGTSGFAPYLYKLYTITHENEILELVKGIIKYERSVFYSKDIPGWHSSIEKKEMDVSWCNGVAGILLSKLLLKEYGYDDKVLDSEIKLAFESVCRVSLGNNLPYCHGDISALAIIRYYSNVMNDKGLEKKCINIYQQLYEYLKNEWTNSKKSLNRYNGLMLGAAGLGYSMIKQYDYKNIDEFLWLV